MGRLYIYLYIYHENQPHVAISIPYMDPMGYLICILVLYIFCWRLQSGELYRSYSRFVIYQQYPAEPNSYGNVKEEGIRYTYLFKQEFAYRSWC